MPATLSPREFVDKWRYSTRTERSASQEHFLDLCRMVGHPSPAEADPTGEWFTFEAGANKALGGEGFADVWKKGFFALEYKGPARRPEPCLWPAAQLCALAGQPAAAACLGHAGDRGPHQLTNTAKGDFILTLDDLLTPRGWIGCGRCSTTRSGCARAPPCRSPRMRPRALRSWRPCCGATARRPRPSPFLIRLLFACSPRTSPCCPSACSPPWCGGRCTRRRGSASNWRGCSSPCRRAALPLLIPHVDGRLFEDAVLPAGCGRDARPLGGVRAGLGQHRALGAGHALERSLDPDKRSQLGARYQPRGHHPDRGPGADGAAAPRWAVVRQRAGRDRPKRDQATGARAPTARPSWMPCWPGSPGAGRRARVDRLRLGQLSYVSLRLLLDLWQRCRRPFGWAPPG